METLRNRVDRLAVRSHVLVFNDECRDVIAACLDPDAYAVSFCNCVAEFNERLEQSDGEDVPFDLVIWDLIEPFDAGLEQLRQFRESHAATRTLLLASREAMTALPALKTMNVESIIVKPFHAYELKSGIASLLDGPRLREATRSDEGVALGLIGASPEIRRVFSLIRKIGPSHVSVFVTGESGSGKEMVANAIHRVSTRSAKPFVAINCAAIPRELLESELFGHAKGAFTGASSHRRGLFEEAHEGTIFLDEIGDLPLPLQAKILRLIQTRQVKALGQNAIREVDVRIVSATHKNVKTLIQKGEFREDLYYRLNVMPIHIPPLRDRKEDIVLLAEHFLRRYSDRAKCHSPALSRRALAKLLSLPWKGNVRELENVIERAIVLSDGTVITENEILSEEIEPIRYTTEDLFNAGMSLKDIEREYIRYVLSRTGNRKEAATRILGIDRKTLYRKEKVYGIRSSGELN